LIVFRSPNLRYNPRYRSDFKAFWWTTDQVTIGDFRALGASVDYVVTISPYHTEYHKRVYQIPADKIGHIDLGVRIEDYMDALGLERVDHGQEDIEKVRNRMIYCSIPDRGLSVLLKCWPKIKEIVEDASLVITSDYTLWGAPGAGNSKFRLDWARQPDVHFLGAIPRKELIKQQLSAEVQAYPCTYEELFCISAAECQVAGAVPVTSAAGALETTNEFGLIVPGNPATDGFAGQFAERIATLLTAERSFLEQQRRMMQAGAIARFDWSAIAERWEQLFEEGRLK
jgi:glycosyltransferase involved in cell wall biosynthesis